MYCTNCGAYNEEGSSFCANCGSSINDATIQSNYSGSSDYYLPQVQKKNPNTLAFLIIMLIALAVGREIYYGVSWFIVEIFLGHKRLEWGMAINPALLLLFSSLAALGVFLVRRKVKTSIFTIIGTSLLIVGTIFPLIRQLLSFSPWVSYAGYFIIFSGAALLASVAFYKLPAKFSSYFWALAAGIVTSFVLNYLLILLEVALYEFTNSQQFNYLFPVLFLVFACLMIILLWKDIKASENTEIKRPAGLPFLLFIGLWVLSILGTAVYFAVAYN